MQLTRDLFPTDARTPYFTLTLESRDVAGHSLLSGLSDDDRARIASEMAAAVTAIARVLRDAAAHETPSRGSSSFGCGT